MSWLSHVWAASKLIVSSIDDFRALDSPLELMVAAHFDQHAHTFFACFRRPRARLSRRHVARRPLAAVANRRPRRRPSTH